jgi:hypothetical protein
MEEQPINFNINDDPELLVISDEKIKKEILDLAKNLSFSGSELFNRLKESKLEKGLCQTLLSLLESYVVSLHKNLNYDSTLKEEHNKRYIEIRRLNSENHELRQQLGNKVSAEDVREKLKNMKDTIYDWWKEEGFGYVSETTFHPYQCSIKLSCSLSFHHKDNQIDYLKSKGYEILELERGCFELKQTDKNIELLICEVKKRFPSSRLFKLESHNWHDVVSVRDAEFGIRNFEDI